ncbi:nuclear transport factor 2 family protein [Chitinasiproducens palmae]|uniref:SnoaL-like domain-containing protein n=1 Tax=Chitinasiproducens palmae TaxID=1770053 RepID=A0A1H2PRZ9_9BURK|nr:nuclear transport factor 2 family protein [Chitinasiproducens palmae]SDV49715.1 SnoaL-like domain-containing protein [Chitinasiproducens palmae]
MKQPANLSAAVQQSATDKLLMRVAIDEIQAEFAHCLDHARYEALAQLFTPDARYTSGARALRGREAIRAFFATRAALGPRASRHLYSGLRLVDTQPDRITATSVWLSFAANAALPLDEVPIFMVADFHDTFERGVDGRWRIAARTIIAAFRNPAAAPRVA